MKNMYRSIMSLALAASVVMPAAAAPIRLKSGEVDTSVRVANTVAATLYAAEDAKRVYLVQCQDSVSPAWRETIELAGGKILGYVPDNAYLVAANGEVAAAIASRVKYAYFGDYRPEYKLAASVKDVLAQAATMKTASNDATFKASAYAGEFLLSIFPFVKAADVAEKVSALDGCVVIEANGDVVRAKLSEASVSKILTWPEVEWLEPYIPEQSLNDKAVGPNRMDVKAVWPNAVTGLDLSGKGQIVAVCDTGLDTGNTSTLHEDVRGRVTRTYCYGRSNSWSDPDGHGTHVVGSVLGNGAKSSNQFRGVAYEASLIFQSSLNSSGGLTLPSDYKTIFQDAYDTVSGKKGARIHSNSWGSGSQYLYWNLGVYNSGSRAIDQFTFEHPDMLIFFAAGNEGVDYDRDGVIDSDSLCNQATAKNCMAVGASENDRTSGGYSGYTWGLGWPDEYPVSPISGDKISGGNGMAAFSSRGPCDDGRIKPDIVAPGTDIISVHSSVGDWGWMKYNTYYAYMGGTSMATPLTAGAAVLVRQWLVEKQKITNPDGATVKAVMLAGAKSLTPGQYGTGSAREIPSSYPNNVEGWGQVNIRNSLANTSGVTVFDGKIIGHGETQEYKVSVNNAGSPLAIVMAYADAPASLTSSAQLVNDLDLTVTTPSGTTLYPNSRTSPDRINNVEGVRIASAQKGVYTIKVKAYSITSPMATSWTGGKANATRYSVAVNGATQSAALQVSDCFLSKQAGKSVGSASSATEFLRGETVYVYGRIHNPGAVDYKDGFTVKHELLVGSVSKGELPKSYTETIPAGGNYDIASDAWSGLQGLAVGSNYKYRLTLTASGADPVVQTVSFTVKEPPNPLASVEILGASTVGGGSKTTYTCRATLTDGSVVTASPVWSMDSGSSFASLSQGGVLSAYATTASRSVVIRASCTYNGVTRSGTKTVAINPVLTLNEALDCPTWSLQSGGDAEWFGQKTRTHDGVDAAQSGAIADGQTSYFQTTVTGPGTLSFWYGVSTEVECDELVVYVDGDWRLRASGKIDWQQHSLVLDSGSHVVKFAYEKDVNGSAGDDAVYLDQLAWTGDLTPESLTITGNGTVAAGSTLQLGCTALMSDGSTRTVTSGCTWSIASGSAYADISITTGLLTAKPSTVDRSVTVHASYEAGGVEKSTTRTIVITGVEPEPAAPVITRSGEGDYSAAVLNWTAADNASSYRVYRSTGTTRPSSAYATLGKVLSYRDTSASPGVEYLYWVSAVNTSGESVSGSAVAYRAVQLTVTQDAVSLEANGGTTNITVKSNVSSVSCAASESWLSASCTSSSLTITAQPNASEESRTAFVTLTAAGSTAHSDKLVVAVFQSGVAAAEQAPDLTFATFDQDWDSDYALYTAETEGADKACRLFNVGDTIHLRYGWGNFGDGAASGIVTNVIEVGRRHENIQSDSVDERDIEIDVLTRHEAVEEVEMEPGFAEPDIYTATEWKSLQPGVYIAKVILNEAEALEEADYYNNDLGFRFAVCNSVTLQTALDCESSSLQVSTVSDQWYGTAGLGYDGEDCAMTKLAGDGSKDVLTAKVSGAGTLSFVYKVATEATYDVLTFKDGSTELLKDSGIGEWKQVSFDIAAGDHTFTWTYAKDAIGSDGDDCVYLDKLVWTPVRVGEAPSDFTVTKNKSTLSMIWTAVADAKGYVIERAMHDKDDWQQIYAGAVSKTVYDNAARGGVIYDYRIKTVYSDGESGWSAVVSGYLKAAVNAPAYRWIPAASGMDGFALSPNGRWKAESNQPWLTINTTSGSNACKFVYRFTANTTDKERTAKITLTVGETENGTKADGYWITKEITVKQRAAIETGGTLPLEEAANTTLRLSTSKDYPWIGQRRISHDGVASIRSGEIGQNATSRVETVVATGGTLTFWWGTSSRVSDKLTLYVNGVKQGAISGYGGTSAGLTDCKNWTAVTNTIPEAGAVIVWEYVRVDLTGQGEDAAFVDQITWEPKEREVSPEDAWFQKYYPDLFDQLGVTWENRKTMLTMQSPGTNKGGKRYPDGTVICVRDDYAAGTNPLDSDDLFRANIEIVDGVPKVGWTPTLEPAEAALRNYLIYGRKSLSAGSWQPVAEGHEQEYQFFKVSVEVQ